MFGSDTSIHALELVEYRGLDAADLVHVEAHAGKARTVRAGESKQISIWARN